MLRDEAYEDRRKDFFFSMVTQTKDLVHIKWLCLGLASFLFFLKRGRKEQGNKRKKDHGFLDEFFFINRGK